jgi:putative ribosome biogenesis GTPase RsgA
MEDAPLLERGEPLERLTALVERSRAGEGTVVVLAGPAGVGKTRLLRELTATAPARVLDARATSRPSRPTSGGSTASSTSTGGASSARCWPAPGGQM